MLTLVIKKYFTLAFVNLRIKLIIFTLRKRKQIIIKEVKIAKREITKEEELKKKKLIKRKKEKKRRKNI